MMIDDPKIPRIVGEYVREKIEDDVHAMLDDPHIYFQGMSPQEILLHIQKMDRIGQIAELELSKVMIQDSVVKFQRLKDFIGAARAEAPVF